MPVSWEPPAPHLCGGCGGRIADRYYLLAVDRQWHARCLTCCECKGQLDSELTCFARDGNIYCKDDYYRLFAVKRCARCQRGIFASELVMRARELVYHLHCFTCAWCNTALTQGDYFGLRDNLVYCRAHYELVLHAHLEQPPAHHPPRYPGSLAALLPPPGDPGGPGAFSPFSGGVVRKGRPRKRKNAEGGVVRDGLLSQTLMLDSADGGLHLASMDSNSGPPPGLGHSGPQRTKRMRTSFKHHQLRTMKSYFAINQNPDAKDLKQLAQKTGLSKRVLQVWFQNARAKWRRNNLRQVDQQPGGAPTPQQQSSQPQHAPPHVSSPGATSSFSEPSPCGTGADLPPPSAQPQLEYDHPAMVPRHISPGAESSMPLTSFQELF